MTPLEQTIVAQIFLEFLPDAIDQRVRWIKAYGYKKYMRDTKKTVSQIKQICKRQNIGEEEYLLNHIYSAFQSRQYRSHGNDYQIKIRTIGLFLEYFDYFIEDGKDRMMQRIACNCVENGLEIPS